MVQIVEKKPTQERLEDEAKGGVVFFGEVDYNQHGRIGNAFPAWYFSRKEEEMKEQANYIRNQIDKAAVKTAVEYLIDTKRYVEQKKYVLETIHNWPKPIRF